MSITVKLDSHKIKRLEAFFTSKIYVKEKNNSIAKSPSDENAFSIEQNTPPNRFFEYPWDHNNKILINEVSGLHRLVQADAIGLKLEQVNKLIKKML